MDLNVLPLNPKRMQGFGVGEVAALDRDVVAGFALEFSEHFIDLDSVYAQVLMQTRLRTKTHIHAGFQPAFDEIPVNEELKIRDVCDGADHMKTGVHEKKYAAGAAGDSAVSVARDVFIRTYFMLDLRACWML